MDYKDALKLLNDNTGKLKAPATRYDSGIPAVNALFGGGIPAGIYTTAGDPGAGKTSFVLQCLQSLKVNGHMSIFIALEGKNNASDVMRRMGMDQGVLANFMPAMLDGTDLRATSEALCELLEVLARNNISGLPIAMGTDSFKHLNGGSVQGQKRAIEQLAALNEKLRADNNPGIIMFLIAHIDAASRGKGKENKKLQGAAELTELCDCPIMFIDQTPAGTPTDKPRHITLELSKNRHGAIGQFPGFRLTKQGFLFPKVQG